VIRPERIDRENLDVQSRATIEQTPGLTFERGTETFADVGGLEFIQRFALRLAEGPQCPVVVVRVEELEKAMSGASGGDLSGTSSDALQVILSEMEDNDWNGILAYGPPGAGKSLFGKSFANTIGAKAVRFDPNATKQSLVGQSGQNIRRTMKVLKTIGGSRVFFIASVNRLEAIPPELQRRFRRGVWYFDAPTEDEQQVIWKLNREKYFIADDDPTPAGGVYTGADIRNICETAWALACPLQEALQYVVPLYKQSPRVISDARELAHGRFIDAGRGGTYQWKERDQ
jgi:SpoVK/Ycf46/Vps4 family AAA+-type ATPase